MNVNLKVKCYRAMQTAPVRWSPVTRVVWVSRIWLRISYVRKPAYMTILFAAFAAVHRVVQPRDLAAPRVPRIHPLGHHLNRLLPDDRAFHRVQFRPNLSGRVIAPYPIRFAVIAEKRVTARVKNVALHGQSHA